jgi:acetate kinase
VNVLTVNAGSSSLKLAVLDADDVVLAARESDTDDIGDEIARLLDESGPVDAVGHRVVHGGAAHVGPERVTPALVKDLEELVPLAPLHQPVALAGIRAVDAALPDVPSVACFDTAFHADLPAAAATYAVPHEWRQRFAVRRYGAHGLSHAYASRRAAELLGDGASRVVVAHLGSGASLCAVLDGRSMDTTMGFTPMEGLVMATRSGSVDPGLVLWLLTEGGLSADQVADGLDRHGGLLALAGTRDMAEVVERAEQGAPDAVLALDVYVHRLVGLVATMAAALGGLDALVFTGGVGERADEVRRLTAQRLAHLGVQLDEAANAGARPDVDVSAAAAPVRTLVVAAREDLEIARGTRSVLAG